MSSIDCLLPLVGLSRKECCCTDIEDRPVNWDESESGHYIDDIGDGIQLSLSNAATDCGTNKMWNLLDRARTEGAMELVDIMSSEILRMKAGGFQGIPVQLGDIHKHAAYYFPSQPRIGVEVVANPVRGGQLKVNQIGIWLNIATAVTIQIYNNRNFTTPLHSFTTTTAAGALTYINTTVSLPVVDQYGRGIKYYFSYQLPVGAQPSNFPLYCGCGGESRTWMRHMTLKGFQVAAMGDMAVQDANMGEAMGLVVFGEVICDPLSFLCAIEMDSVMGKVIAKTLQLLQVCKMAMFLIESTDLNRATLLSKEILGKKIEANGAKAENLLKNILTVLPATNDCFSCNNIQEVKELLV